MFGDVVMGVDHHNFEQAFDKIKKKYKAELDTDVPEEGMVELVRGLQGGLPKHVGRPVPAEPVQAARAGDRGGVQELDAPRAIKYRGSTRSRASRHGGERADDGLRQHGRRLGHGRRVHAQPVDGREQVLRRVPDQRPGRGRGRGHPHAASPPARCASGTRELQAAAEDQDTLEKHYKDMQDIEFTIERGKLYMLQTRNGKRTGAAAVKIACDMVKEKLITEERRCCASPRAT
jgi:pyruvate,orthophosphate dikinase